MLADEKIKNSDELEFAIFCIENVAAKLGVDPVLIYEAFTEKSDILIDKTEAINRLRYEKPNLQICFRTEKALPLLCFEGSEMI